MKINAKTIRRQGLGLVLAVVALVFVGDLGYSLLTRHRLAQWERGIPRDAAGVRMGCAEFAVGNPQKTTILMVHGFGDSPAVFARMAPALANLQICCHTLRLPGFAEPMEQYRKTSLKKWRRALDRRLEVLAADHNSIWLVGHSMGGTLVLDRLFRDSESISGGILMAPLVEVASDRSPLGIPPRYWHQVARAGLHFTRTLEICYAVNAVDPRVKKFPRDRFVPYALVREMFKTVRAIHQRARTINVPVLLFTAEQDQVSDNEAARKFVEHWCAGPKAEVRLEYSGHVIPLDLGWLAATREIAFFLQKYAAADDAASAIIP